MKRLIETARKILGDSDSFLSKVSGIIHVGAHLAEERDLYARHDLNVLWVESNPEIFDQLKARLVGFDRQKAVLGLVADVDGKNFVFHISSNEGASSSIFEFGKHSELWPEVKALKTRELQSITLPSLLKREQEDASRYDALVMDTQGAELLVLKGAIGLLGGLKFIRAEAADFESYKDCCKLADLDSFLSDHHFRRTQTNRFASKPGVGSYFNALYAAQKIPSSSRKP